MRILFLLLLVSFTTGYSQGYRGAELRTLEPLLYGKFEVCYKPAQGEGLVSSFFTYIVFVPVDVSDIDSVKLYDAVPLSINGK